MNSLMWTCVYGNDTYFDILKVSLDSLIKFGKYEGSICIFSDRAAATFDYVPDELQNQTTILPFPVEPNISVRYNCVEKLPRNYDVYLYVDTDIVYDAPIAPVLWEIANSNSICFSSEIFRYPGLNKPIKNLLGTNPQNAEWFGLSLIAPDNSYWDNRVLPVINSGIIGSNDFAALLEASRWIKETIPKIDADYIKRYGDQPIVNILMAQVECDTAKLTRYMHFTSWSLEENAIRSGLGMKGMVHFLWSGEYKLQQMNLYVATLNSILD